MSEYCHNCGKTISEDIEKFCPPCKATGESGFEITGNQRVTSIRRDGADLQMQITEDYQRHESGTLICSGSRSFWKPVEQLTESATT